MTFENQSVLIVGASGGIGAATVTAFAKAGARVVGAGRTPEKLKTIANQPSVTIAEIDILNNDMVERFFDERDPFDHVVVTAASFKTGSVAALSLEDAHACMESKFWGAYRIARAARIAPQGSLTFVTGFLAGRPNPNTVLLGAVNGGLDALAKGLALEKAPIRVNTVSPGLTDTPLYSGMPSASRVAMFESTAKRLPVRRVGQAEDIASAIVFVASNPYITGTTVTVDGGGTIA
jgi:NAD(P)-dependent dehydrogenase (short-subunit alcohol dehydrogenase family)